MADDNDNDKNSTEPNKNDKNTTNEQPKWKETCIGIWTRGTRGEEDGSDWICNGISLVKMKKDAERNKIKLSKTRGLQVIIMESDKKKRHKNKDKNNEDVDSERDPQHHVFPPEDAELGRRLFDELKKKGERIEKSVEHYVESGVKFSDMWYGFSGLLKSCYQTSFRMLSYCKPNEKANQMYNFASARIKNLGSQWRKKRNNDKNNKK